MSYWKWFITKGKMFMVAYSFLLFIDYGTYQDRFVLPKLAILFVIIMHPIAALFSIVFWKTYIKKTNNNQPETK